MGLSCPVCGTDMNVVKEEIGEFKRRFSEFKMRVLFVRCPKCDKIGLLRLVPDLCMENLEFPYEGSI